MARMTFWGGREVEGDFEGEGRGMGVDIWRREVVLRDLRSDFIMGET